MPSNWFFTRSGHAKAGPVTARELKRLASTGSLQPSDMVQRDGGDRTVEARRIKGLFHLPPDPVGTPAH